MPLDNQVVSDNSPVVTRVELGVAKLNTVSHHEYLRCAKYVNPLIRQLSVPESETTANTPANYNRNSLIIVDSEVVESDTEQDVYEDQMESELESSLENALDLDEMEESDTTVSETSHKGDTDDTEDFSENGSSEKMESKNMNGVISTQSWKGNIMDEEKESGQMENLKGNTYSEESKISDMGKEAESYSKETDVVINIEVTDTLAEGNIEIQCNEMEGKEVSECESLQTVDQDNESESKTWLSDCSVSEETHKDADGNEKTDLTKGEQYVEDDTVRRNILRTQETDINDITVKETERAVSDWGRDEINNNSGSIADTQEVNHTLISTLSFIRLTWSGA